MTAPGGTAAPATTTHPPACPVTAAHERRMLAAPDDPAVITSAGTLSQGGLLAASRRLATALVAWRGAGSEPVALALPDPTDMIVATLAVLRAGKVYVPVNPHHPAERTRAVLAETGASAAVVRGPAPAGFDADGPRLLDLDDLDDLDHHDAGHHDPGGPGAVPDGQGGGDPVDLADEPAYVLFTSGSTGRPRGYAQTRGAMVDNVARHEALGIGPGDRVTLINADGFVSAVSNPFIALLNGAALVPWSFQHDEVDAMLDRLDATGVTVYYSFPSFLRRLGQVSTTGRQAPGVRLVYLGGEPVRRSDVELARRLFPRARVAVGLNSTETGLTLLHVIDPGEEVPDPVPVGSPVPGVAVRVLAEDGDGPRDGHVTDPGVPGRIEVAGRWLRPRLWEHGVLVDVATPAPDGAWRFRTGDRGRQEHSGSVIHLGRADGVEKVRGFRVETVEVEDTLTSLPAVADAAVVVDDDPAGVPGDVELVAHVVLDAGGGTDPATLRRALAERLPTPSVPSRIEVHEALPRTANGKLDRRALAHAASMPSPAVSPPVVDPDAAGPATSGELGGVIAGGLGELWGELLGDAPVSRDDDFFALGGTSISALRLVSRVRKEWGATLTLAAFFATPTVGTLIDAVAATDRPAPVEARP